MQVRLVFDEPESGVTIIKLKQTDVPFLLQVWELNRGGEHRERLERAHLPEDTCSVRFWGLKKHL
uniref:Uncharacterized protein n=1 Tax=Aegilops tauschii subsp. strangulata TaxID=200361 RepID=A0A453RTU4_AEGTS